MTLGGGTCSVVWFTYQGSYHSGKLTPFPSTYQVLMALNKEWGFIYHALLMGLYLSRDWVSLRHQLTVSEFICEAAMLYLHSMSYLKLSTISGFLNMCLKRYMVEMILQTIIGDLFPLILLYIKCLPLNVS